MTIQWSGPSGGLGNRMLALASTSAIAGLLNAEIVFPWVNSPVCPCGYDDLFRHIPGIRVQRSGPSPGRIVQTDRWNPVRIGNDFERALGIKLNDEDYYLRFIQALRTMTFSDDVRYRLSRRTVSGDHRTVLSVHIRRTDRMPHHRKLYRHPFSAFRIARNTGFLKSMHYLSLPESMVVRMENKAMARIIRTFIRETPHAVYSVYSDSREGVQGMIRFCRAAGISEHRYAPGYPGSQGSDYWGEYGMRKTRIRDALVELVEMSESSGIIQNNPASTFALVASIRGRVPIVSKQPIHEFWRKITRVLGDTPNRIGA